jgi:4'-phosphopantetheinyl transferase
MVMNHMSKPLATALGSTANGTINLWLVDLDAAPPDQAPESVLDASELARASRFKFEIHARRYRTSHIALRQILGQELSIDASAVLFTTGSHGKPRVSNAGAVHFNLSHSSGWALVGVSHRGPIGIDIELLTPINDADLLAHKNFTAAEYATYLQSPPEQRLEAFYRGWTRKEACLKALGSGLSIEPQEFEAGLGQLPLDTGITVHGQTCRMLVACIDLPIPALAAFASLADADSPLAM